jgi:hypothetical protein
MFLPHRGRVPVLPGPIHRRLKWIRKSDGNESRARLPLARDLKSEDEQRAAEAEEVGDQAGFDEQEGRAEEEPSLDPGGFAKQIALDARGQQENAYRARNRGPKDLRPLAHHEEFRPVDEHVRQDKPRYGKLGRGVSCLPGRGLGEPRPCISGKGNGRGDR